MYNIAQLKVNIHKPTSIHYWDMEEGNRVLGSVDELAGQVDSEAAAAEGMQLRWIVAQG
jgi:hypothetical protein